MARKVYDKSGNVVKDRGSEERADDPESDERAGAEEDEDEDSDEADADDEDDAADEDDADEDDADEDEGGGEEDEEEDEEGDEDDVEDDVPETPAPSARSRVAAKPAVHDEDDEDEGEDDDEDEDDDASEEEDTEDPGWWAPHAVLGALVIIGVLGFFGVFNEALSFLRAPAGPAEAASSAAPVASAPPASRPAPPAPPEGRRIEAGNEELFGAQHILVMHTDSRRKPPTITRSKEEAKTRAEEALKKARQPGADFDQLVTEYSDEPGADRRKGNLGNFRKGAMVPEFQAGLEKTKVGAISDLVETPFGYHIIKRTK
jgi:hypothetical protein